MSVCVCACDYIYYMFIVFPPPPLVLWSWSMGRNCVFFANQGLRKKSKKKQGRLEEIG